jgi:hypothetical protein
VASSIHASQCHRYIHNVGGSFLIGSSGSAVCNLIRASLVTSKTRLLHLCVELSTAFTTYVHYDTTMEADAMAAVDHVVAAFGARVVVANIQDEAGASGSWWPTSRTRLACLCVELDVASTTYVHCDVTLEADAVVAVDHAVVAFGVLDEFPPMRHHGDSATTPVCSDADVGATTGTRLQRSIAAMPTWGRCR